MCSILYLIYMKEAPVYRGDLLDAVGGSQVSEKECVQDVGPVRYVGYSLSCHVFAQPISLHSSKCFLIDNTVEIDDSPVGVVSQYAGLEAPDDGVTGALVVDNGDHFVKGEVLVLMTF